jgi:AMIN domain
MARIRAAVAFTLKKIGFGSSSCAAGNFGDADLCAEQLQTSPMADDDRLVTQLRACYLRSLEADLAARLVRRVRIKYLAAITLAGLFCGGTVWLLRGRLPLFGSATTATRSPVASQQPPAGAVSSPVVESRVAFLEVLPGISYESSPNLVRFFVDVPEHFDLDAVALRNPDRIYFDVPTSAARVRKSVDMSNDFVRRIRVSPRDGGVTRIVLDLKCYCTYRFKPSSGPRNRVQIEVSPQSTPAPTRAPVGRIAPSPSRASLA